MMFQFMYRLKKKHGAVLFAVIAVMALLIAMSTAAYYTARGSYNTVVSSYSYSQLYLSAISAADMVSAAIMNEEIPAAGAGNKFTAVQTAINQHLNPSFATDGTYTIPTDVIYLKSDNLSGMTFNASTTTADVIAALHSATSVEPGVLDGLTVKISILKADPPANVQTTLDSGLTTPTMKVENQKFTMKISYSIETTAYYRDDTITVQDIVSNNKKFERQMKTPMQYTPGSSNGGSFPPLNPNTTTGQGKPDENGVAGSSGRAVLVSVKRLDGDMSFHNDITYIGSQANNVGNKIDGSLSADGSVYFSKCNVNVTGEDQHWYIGKDFVTTNDQAGNIRLGKNNLYVGGDMILGTQQGVQAEEIFVNGDLYVLKQCKIDTKKLHVSGNIYFTDYNPDGTPRTEALKDSLDTVIAATDNVNSRLSGDFDLELGGSVIAEGKTAPYEKQEWYPVVQVVTAQDQISSGQNVKVGDKYSNVKDKSDHTQINGAGSFDSTAQLENGFTILDRDDDQDKYVPIHKEGSLLDAIAQNTNKTMGTDNTLSKGDQITYPNYTGKTTAYENSLNLDFSNMNEITEEDASGNKKVVGYSKDCEILDASGNTLGVAKIKVNGTDMKDVTVNIPYIEDGFVLSYGSTNFMGGDISNNAIVKYNIASDPSTVDDEYLKVESSSGSNGSGKTMPIILAANTSDGNFSWKGDAYGDNGSGAYVSVRDDVKVSFEMGNLDTTTNTYKPYDFESDVKNNLKIPTYLLGAKSTVGSESLIDMMKDHDAFYIEKVEDGPDAGKMFIVSPTGQKTQLSESNIPDNNVMIVSNSTGTAFQADYKDTLIGGYLYAPGGRLSASNLTNGAVINIGSVVISDYEANHADYHVKLPKPSDMDAFIGPLTNKQEQGSNPGTGTSTPIPGAQPTFTIPTYQFGDWGIVGSNYVGG